MRLRGVRKEEPTVVIVVEAEVERNLERNAVSVKLAQG
jgi:hypothetical protein